MLLPHNLLPGAFQVERDDTDDDDHVDLQNSCGQVERHVHSGLRGQGKATADDGIQDRPAI